MNREQLVDVLERRVPADSVTTHAQVSLWGYGVPNLNQPVRSLLRGAGNHGHQRLSNRVVGVDGKLADLPEGADQQQQRLLAETGATLEEVERNMQEAIELHLEGLREEGCPIPEPSTSSAYIEISA